MSFPFCRRRQYGILSAERMWIMRIHGIKKSKLNRADYIRKVMDKDRTGEVREAVKEILAEVEKKDSQK